MPGVPSGRGCEACRKQKKKCDRVKPSCSRCSRLQIACVGAGLQRYKFKEDHRSVTLATRRLCGNRSSSQTSSTLVVLPRLARTPSNETTLLGTALIKKLQTTDDVRYHLSWNFGGFIDDIPRRLGTSEALDAAALAILNTHSSLGSHLHGSMYSNGLITYTRAVQALRRSLDDPAKARQIETLCAVMLLFICEMFLGLDSPSHGEGAAQLLKARAYYDRQDDFECKLLVSLRGPVLFSALGNPKISFTPEEWKRIVENELDGSTSEGVMMQCMAKLPNIMQRGSKAIRERADLQLLTADVNHQYLILTGLLRDVLEILNSIRKLPRDGSSQSAMRAMTAHFFFLRTYGIGLAVCLSFNCVLQALDPKNSDLATEARSFCQEVVQMADEANPYRPLGAGYLQICLIAAWCSCEDEATRAILEELLKDYRKDFPETPSTSDAATMRAMRIASRRLSLQA